VLFDDVQARKGLALNRLCFSFNSAENREAFLRDEDGYCAKFGSMPSSAPQSRAATCAS